MKRIMAICDIDPFYSERFADYINKSDSFPFLVVSFTNLEDLLKFSQKHQVSILLINDFFAQQSLNYMEIDYVVLLVDEPGVKHSKAYLEIYKYQPADQVVKTLLADYCETMGDTLTQIKRQEAAIIGVYSPIHRCLKTSLALTMGQIWGKDINVLYINMEEYSGFYQLIDSQQSGTLADLLYYYQQNKYSQIRLNSLIQSWRGMDYIGPASYPEDLHQPNEDAFANLIKIIAGNSDYEIILVDAGAMARGVLPVLEQCQRIYMPIKEDLVSRAKIAAFEKYLIHSGREELLERIQHLKLPYHNHFEKCDHYLDQLLWGEFGDYVRELLKGQHIELA